MPVISMLEVLRPLDAAALELRALRCGVAASTPHRMTQLLQQPDQALRTLRRAQEVGAGRMARLLVELAGIPLAHSPGLDLEVRLLHPFFPMVQLPDQAWVLPAEFAAAALQAAESERFSLTTLLARCADQELRPLAKVLDTPSIGARAARIARMAAQIEALMDETPPPDGDAADFVRSRPHLPVSAIAEVHLDMDRPGDQFWITLRDGTRHRTASRQWALRQPGQSLPLPALPPIQLPTRPRRTIRLPQMMAAPVLVTFATLRAAEEAVALPAFLERIAQRLDDRRFALRPGQEVREVQAFLHQAGFALSDIQAHG
jgi:hypothetical protein